MLFVKNLYAYQLKIGMQIFVDDCWYEILGLSGSFIPGRGLVVVVELSGSVIQVDCTAVLGVLCHE